MLDPLKIPYESRIAFATQILACSIQTSNESWRLVLFMSRLLDVERSEHSKIKVRYDKLQEELIQVKKELSQLKRKKET